MKKQDKPYVNPDLLNIFGSSKAKPTQPKKSKSGLRKSVKPSSPLRANGVSKANPNRKPLNETWQFRTIAGSILLIMTLLLFTPASDVIAEKLEEAHASEAIKEIGSRSGFNYEGKLLFYRAHPELVDADSLDSVCPSGDGSNVEFGCYLPDKNKIYILEVPDPTYKEVEYTTAAHEMLHAAWHKFNDEQRGQTARLIKQIYTDKNNPASSELATELEGYNSDQATVYSELHSFIGSEYDVSTLSPELRSYYSKYFSNQTAPVSANSQFDNAINSESTNLDNRYAKIEAIYDTAQTYKRQHLDNIEAAMNYDEYIGDYYTYNKNVDAYNHNLTSYNNQVDLYNSEKDAYNAEVEKFNAVLRAFYPTRTQIKLFSQ